MKLSRKARILTAVIAVLILIPLLLVLGVRAYVRLPHLGYYHKSERAFKIPGLGDGFVPQGIDYDTERHTYLVTGYDKAGGQSPLYLVGDDGKLQKTLRYTLADGTPYTGHAGGIAVGGDFVYLAGGADATVHVFARADLEKTQDGGAITAVGSLSCYLEENKDDHLGPAFLQVSDGNLIVGEFYRPGNYETPENHYVTCPSGATQRALALVYPLDGTSAIGVSTTPVSAYSLPDLAQGFAVSEGRIYITASWALAHSSLYIYDTAKIQRTEDVTVLGVTLPCYALDDTALVKRASLPPMAEEPLILNGKLYVMNESACNTYKFGKFTGGAYCYATPLSYFEGKD